MDNITQISFGPLPENSKEFKPLRMYFCQNEMEKNWDLIRVENSVIVIIYNKTSNKLVLVKQFRPAVYYASISELGCKFNEKIDLLKFPAKLGMVTELCGGYVKNNLPLAETAKEIVFQQCGFNISTDRLEEVLTYKSGVGTTGASQTLFYCEVSDNDKVADGDGNEDKVIHVLEVSILEAQDMVKQGVDNSSPPNCLFGILWFLRNKSLQK